MIGSQFRTVLWLKWRLLVNRYSRQSMFTRILSWAFFVFGTIFAVSSAFGAFSLAMWFLPTGTPPNWLIYPWLLLILSYLGLHMGTLISELNQSEVLSIDKFLHLPMSPRGVFFLNFLASSLNLTVATFLPTSFGLAFAMCLKYGWACVVIFPLICTFFLMIASFTHQFRGWIQSMMSDPKRRRTVIAMGTAIFALAGFAPAILGNYFDRREKGPKPKSQESILTSELEEKFKAGQITQLEFDRQVTEVAARTASIQEKRFRQIGDNVRVVAWCIPLAWPAAGAEELANRRILHPSLFIFGLLTLSATSLHFAYRTTMKQCLGQNSRWLRPPIAANGSGIGSRGLEADSGSTIPVPAKNDARNWLAGTLPFLSEQQSAIALATLRSLSRMPQAKLAMFMPMVVIILLGGMSSFGQKTANLPQDFRGFSALGVCFFVMLGVTQFVQNQFGFERDGFRVYLLSPVSSRDVLIGKNMALVPIAGTLCLLALAVVQIFSPMMWTHFFASIFQIGSVFLVVTLVGNLMSIYVPLAVKSGSMKPANLTIVAGLMQFLVFLLVPIGIALVTIPLGVELLVTRVWEMTNWPIYLPGSIVVFGIMCLVYRLCITWEASLLEQRKLKILETVVNSGN